MEDPPEQIKIQENVKPIEIEVEMKVIKIEEIEMPPEPPEEPEDSDDKEIEISIDKDQDILIQCAGDTPFSKIIPLIHIVKQYGLTPMLILFGHDKNDLLTEKVVIVKKTEKSIHYRKKCEKCDYIEKETLISSLPKGSFTISIPFTCMNCGYKNKGQIRKK